MRFTLFIYFALIISGCSPYKYESVQLFDVYYKLRSEVKSGDILRQKDNYFTSEYLLGVNANDNKSGYILRLTGYIERSISHYQSIAGDSACLTINGLDENNEPLSLHVEYKKYNRKWLVNYMFVHFLESSKDFSKSVICPREAERNLIKQIQ